MSQKFTKSSFVFVALVMILSLLAGCTTPTATPTTAPLPTDAPKATEAPKPTEVPPTPEPTKEPVHLTVWVLDRVGTDAMATVKTAIEQWAAETGNTVEVVEGNQFEMLNKIPVAVPAGEGPDLFMNLNNYVGADYLGQLIAPLESYLPEEEKANYSAGSLDSFTFDGHLLGIPLAADTTALVYNKDLVPTPPTTMDELITMSKELTQGDTYGFLYPIDNFYYSYPFFSAFGGYIFKWTGTGLDVNDLGFNTPAGIEGMSYLYNLVTTEKLMPADTTYDAANSLFTEGKVGMTISNPAMVPAYEAAGVKVGVAKIPATPNGADPKPFTTYTGFSVSAKSAHIEESAALAVYLGKTLPLPLFQANAGNIPVYTPVFKEDAVKSNEQLAGWLSQVAASDPIPTVNEMNFVWGPASTAFSAVVHGTATAESAMKEAQDLIAQAIAENK